MGIALLGLPAWQTVVAGVAGNALAVAPIVLGTRLFQGRLERARRTARLMRWSLIRARKHERFVNRYGWIGLAAIVAIPFPGTGTLTATALSILTGMRLLPTVGAILIGLLGEAAIIATATTGIMCGAETLDLKK